MFEPTLRPRLAVLFDAENSSASHAPTLVAHIARLGCATVRRAYGDWTRPQLAPWKALLVPLSIRPQQEFKPLGPYTETKEVVGGLFIIEADSPDEALRNASMHPAATLGEEGGRTVELIPMDFYLSR